MRFRNGDSAASAVHLLNTATLPGGNRLRVEFSNSLMDRQQQLPQQLLGGGDAGGGLRGEGAGAGLAAFDEAAALFGGAGGGGRGMGGAPGGGMGRGFGMPPRGGGGGMGGGANPLQSWQSFDSATAMLLAAQAAAGEGLHGSGLLGTLSADPSMLSQLGAEVAAGGGGAGGLGPGMGGNIWSYDSAPGGAGDTSAAGQGAAAGGGYAPAAPLQTFYSGSSPMWADAPGAPAGLVGGSALERLLSGGPFHPGAAGEYLQQQGQPFAAGRLLPGGAAAAPGAGMWQQTLGGSAAGGGVFPVPGSNGGGSSSGHAPGSSAGDAAAASAAPEALDPEMSSALFEQASNLPESLLG